MLTGKEDLLQGLVEAFIMEKGTREFYSQAAARSSTPAVKKAFADLAVWEEKHMAYIRSLYQALLDERDLEGFDEFSKKVAAPDAESGIPVKDIEKRMETYVVTNEKDAFSLALTIEAKSYSLYRDLARRAADTEAKVLFEEMMRQEDGHLQQLHAARKEMPC